MALSAKHQHFVDEYLARSNATDAYMEVYRPKSRAVAASSGHKLLRKAEIYEAIQHRLKETAMLADEVLMHLAAQARGSMGDFIRFNDDNDPALDLQGASVLGKLPLVKKFKTKTRSWQEPTFNLETMENELRDMTETSVEFELYSSQTALELLARHHGLLDKRGSEDQPVHNVDWTVDQWRAEQAKRQQQASEALANFDDEDEPGPA